MRTAPKTKGTRNAAAKAMKSNSCHRWGIPKSQEHSRTQTHKDTHSTGERRTNENRYKQTEREKGRERAWNKQQQWQQSDRRLTDCSKQQKQRQPSVCKCVCVCTLLLLLFLLVLLLPVLRILLMLLHHRLSFVTDPHSLTLSTVFASVLSGVERLHKLDSK